MKTEQSIETILAEQELRKLKEGDLLDYGTLGALIGKDPQRGGYHHVKAARRKVEKELGCVFEASPNIGIKRLIPREVLNRGGRDIKHVRMSIKSGFRRQTTLVPVEEQKLTNDERVKFHAQLSAFGVLAHMTRPSAIKKIEAAATTAARTIPAKETLALFGGGKEFKSESVQ